MFLDPEPKKDEPQEETEKNIIDVDKPIEKTSTEILNETNLSKNNENVGPTSETVTSTSPAKPIYTTSIYINSFGNVDITTSYNNKNDSTTPLSDRAIFFRGERGYATLGPSTKSSSTPTASNTVSLDSEKMYHSDDEAPPARIESLVSINKKKIHQV